MINLKIDPEFQNQIPPLTDDEYKQLEENILKEGKLLSPLIVWNNTLVDGHNRYAILQKHPEIYFSTMPLRFENREEVHCVDLPESVGTAKPESRTETLSAWEAVRSREESCKNLSGQSVHFSKEKWW